MKSLEICKTFNWNDRFFLFKVKRLSENRGNSSCLGKKKRGIKTVSNIVRHPVFQKKKNLVAMIRNGNCFFPILNDLQYKGLHIGQSLYLMDSSSQKKREQEWEFKKMVIIPPKIRCVLNRIQCLARLQSKLVLEL